MSVSVDSIPLENVGFGTQNMFKSEIFIQQNPTVDILVMEEPENNLSHTNMSVLVSKLASNPGKQLFVSTHSSYVANKLGLNHLHLVGNGIVTPLSGLEQDTYNYFLKLPGYNTLRLLLANNVILVEGPADELIVQRAYLDEYGRLPIEDGIDVIAVGGVAFKRYCELAKLVQKKISIITDNDKDASAVQARYAEYGEVVALFIDGDNDHNTLEPSVLAANIHQYETFRDIVYHGAGKDKVTPDQLQSFMTKNKTEWSMRVFQSNSNIAYPRHIRRAIGCVDDE
jgi:predicted ATP-dependent endonuclease of OLD family